MKTRSIKYQCRMNSSRTILKLKREAEESNGTISQMRAKVTKDNKGSKKIVKLRKPDKKEVGRKYACQETMIWMKMSQHLTMMMN